MRNALAEGATPVTSQISGTEYCFDEQCRWLAEHFYPNATDKQLNDLAQEIQDVVEAAEIEDE